MTRLPLALLAVCAAWLCADAATVVPMRRAATFWRTETREAKPDPSPPPPKPEPPKPDPPPPPKREVVYVEIPAPVLSDAPSASSDTVRDDDDDDYSYSPSGGYSSASRTRKTPAVRNAPAVKTRANFRKHFLGGPVNLRAPLRRRLPFKSLGGFPKRL